MLKDASHNKLFKKILNFTQKKIINLSKSSKENLKQKVTTFIEEYQKDEKSADGSDISIIHNVLSYGEHRAIDVMVPRTDIETIDINITLESLKNYMLEKRHTRFPVYENNPDNIIGYINIKDLLPSLLEKQEYNLRSIIRQIMIIPPSIKIIDLLASMRKNKTHIALVVDEFGGADGLITSEDIIEEIVGDIEDEHDEQRIPSFSLINQDTMIASGRLNIEKFEKEFGVNLNGHNSEDVDYDTIGGLILNLTGHIPEKGAKILHPSGIEFEILDRDPRKINKIIIKRVITEN